MEFETNKNCEEQGSEQLLNMYNCHKDVASDFPGGKSGAFSLYRKLRQQWRDML